MKKFEANKNYSTTSACDSNCVFSVKVTRRTAKSVWITGSGIDGEERRAIKLWDGNEYFMPFGNYSMAPMIRA